MDVTVIGGGNAGFETAAQLLAYCKSVTLLHRSPQYSADPVTVAKVLEHPNMKGILNAEPTEVFGEKLAKGLKYKDKTTGEIRTLNTPGIFVEIGMIASTDFVKDLVSLNKVGKIEVDPKTQRSSVTGIWAAGDCTDGLYHQNNIAVGDAVKALEDIYMHLKTT
jgi:alkyl hydroperoxide reductase subunit F